MTLFAQFREKTQETLRVYWELVVVMAPIAVLVQLLSQLGVLEAVSPWFEPVMHFYGLPSELALAWLTGLLVGVWGALIVAFALVPASALTGADMTVFCSLVLVAHAIPVEQRIVAKAGPSFAVTSALRIGGALVFAVLLHQLFSATGWLSQPLDPAWTPASEDDGWASFFLTTGETFAMMLVVLLALTWVMEVLRIAGVLDWLYKGLAPLFRLAGLRAEALPFATVGMLLGISYGSGLMLAQTRRSPIDPRQSFLACVLMGFAHGLIEDTLIVVALGADLTSVLVGRLVFALAATGVIALVIGRLAGAERAPQ